MEIGIGISLVGLCVSQKKASGISSEMVFGFDLTKPSRLSAADIERLKKQLDGYAELFSAEVEIVVAYPVGIDLLEYAALKSLFQRMGIRVRRFINGGMARGLFVSQQETELQGNICCVGCNKGSVELTVLEIADGVVEVLNHEVYPDDSEWDYTVMDQRIAKLAAPYGNLEAVFLHYTKPPKQGQECVSLCSAQRTVRLNDVAASGGALIQAEVLSGKKKDLLPLNLCPFGILCIVGGNEVDLLACDDTIPARQMMEIEIGANKSVDFELFAVSNGTSTRTCIYQTTFTSVPEKRSVKVVAESGADQDTVVSIEANGEKYRLEY